MIWKDEAFNSWIENWGIIYGTESDSFRFVKNIYDSFYLMNVVDNDFVGGDLNKVISDFIEENLELITSL
jgi:methylenetetrahydrofolate reductase (NADPH)